MVHHQYCCVVNCKNNGMNSRCTFYRFPTVPWKLEQRNKWIAAVKRKNADGSPWYPKPHDSICSEDFIGGKKSDAQLSPSYVPTIFPERCGRKVNDSQALNRFARMIHRNKKYSATSTGQMIGPTQQQSKQQQPRQQQQQQQKQQQQPQQKQQPQQQQPRQQQQQPQQKQQPQQFRNYIKTFDAQPGPSTAVLEEEQDDDYDSDSEESCSMEHEVGIITEPLTGIQDPLANNSDRCRFCANITKCVDAIDKPYLKNNKMALILNDINVEIDLNDIQKVCLDCDRKLLEMFCFVVLVKNAQDTLLNADYDTEETETLVVKTECESPTPDDNDEIDEETKEGIVDSITVDETAFVKNDVFIYKKRKRDKDTKKTSKPQKKRKVDDKVRCESTEVIIDMKEEPIERDGDAYTDIHKATYSEDRDTGPDVKPSELDIATNALLNEMAGDGVS